MNPSRIEKAIDEIYELCRKLQTYQTVSKQGKGREGRIV